MWSSCFLQWPVIYNPVFDLLVLQAAMYKSALSWCYSQNNTQPPTLIHPGLTQAQHWRGYPDIDLEHSLHPEGVKQDDLGLWNACILPLIYFVCLSFISNQVSKQNALLLNLGIVCIRHTFSQTGLHSVRHKEVGSENINNSHQALTSMTKRRRRLDGQETLFIKSMVLVSYCIRIYLLFQNHYFFTYPLPSKDTIIGVFGTWWST